MSSVIRKKFIFFFWPGDVKRCQEAGLLLEKLVLTQFRTVSFVSLHPCPSLFSFIYQTESSHCFRHGNITLSVHITCIRFSKLGQFEDHYCYLCLFTSCVFGNRPEVGLYQIVLSATTVIWEQKKWKE